MIETALYVSRSNLEPAISQDVVADIVALARRRNERRGLTGGLIFTGRHFAQVLEGPGETLDGMLTAIAHDGRHTGMKLIHRRTVASRFFFDWRMAYNGPSRLVDRHIAPLIEQDLNALEHELAAQDLNMLIKEFALLRRAA